MTVQQLPAIRTWLLCNYQLLLIFGLSKPFRISNKLLSALPRGSLPHGTRFIRLCRGVRINYSRVLSSRARATTGSRWMKQRQQSAGVFNLNSRRTSDIPMYSRASAVVSLLKCLAGVLYPFFCSLSLSCFSVGAGKHAVQYVNEAITLVVIMGRI